MRTLIAWIEDRRIGSFSEAPQADGGDLFAFEYEASTSRDIVSLTMVPTPDDLRFETRTFPAPFDMILPEGEQRQRIEEARKIFRTDSFSLLSYVGANPINRVRFLTPGTMPQNDPPDLPPPPEIAKCTKGRKLFRDLLEALDLRQGIAGVQPKILGAPSERAKLSPQLRQFRGSTHILKSSTTRFPFLATNEQVCLEVFKAAGLAIPNTTLSADGELLLVDRFDIRDGKCIGFEEAAALMGETSASKYARDYGSLIMSLTKFVRPETEDKMCVDVVKAIVLNHLIGNGDAHLKNFGVLYTDSTDVSLAPFYDCISTLPYIPNDVPALALSLDWYSKAWWPRVKIEEFARDYGDLSHAEVTALIDECIDAVMGGVAALPRYKNEIPAFSKLANQMAEIWTGRVTAFAEEQSIVKRKRARKTVRGRKP